MAALRRGHLFPRSQATKAFPSPLVTTAWLARNLHGRNLVVPDSSFKLPGGAPVATK